MGSPNHSQPPLNNKVGFLTIGGGLGFQKVVQIFVLDAKKQPPT